MQAIIKSESVFEPQDVDSAVQIAKMLVASRLLPKGIDTPEAAFAIIVTGRELGLTVMQSLRSIHVINGKPTLSADLILALVKGSSWCQYFRLVESTDSIATYETQRVEEPSPTSMSFTIEMARRAGVLNNPTWTKYPEAMLRARCIAALARAVYPDVVLGVYETGELEPEVAPVRARVEPLTQGSPRLVAAPSSGSLEPQLRLSTDYVAQMVAATTPGDLLEIWSAIPTADQWRFASVKDARKEAIAKLAKEAQT